MKGQERSARESGRLSERPARAILGHCGRGQAALEVAFVIPVMMMLLFGCFQVARVFFLYHTLQKAVRGGAGMLARMNSVNYCDPADPALNDARNFIVFGNLQGNGTPIVEGLTPDIIQVVPERILQGSTSVGACLCTQDPESCDPAAGGRQPDFVTVNLGGGFPVNVPFPFVNLGTIALKVSVRMPVTGG